MTIPYPFLRTHGADSAICTMAALNAATMVVSDAETSQLIEEFKSNFYVTDEQSCDRSFRRFTPIDSEDDEYLSPTEYDSGVPLRKFTQEDKMKRQDEVLATTRRRR